MINSSLTSRHNTYCGVPADEQIERSRFSEKVPLSRIAANLFQRRQRCRVLYPFGEHQNAEVFADANERFDDAPCLGAVAHAGDEHPVDLQLIERKQKQRLQAGGAHTEVVDRELDPQFVKLFHHDPRRVVVSDARCFGYLQCQPGCG